jgi:hypothetical protein
MSAAYDQIRAGNDEDVENPSAVPEEPGSVPEPGGGSHEVDSDLAPATAPAVTKKPLTEKQRAARRRNGAKSKGPTSEAGKTRSRQNAVKHGAYSLVIPYVERGPLMENRAFVDALRAAVLEDLDPEGAVEELAAVEIADLYIRVARVSRLEAWSLGVMESDDRPSMTADAGFGLFEQRAHDSASAARVARSPRNPDHTAKEFENAANALMCDEADEDTIPDWDPDRGLRPKSVDGWCDLIDRLMTYYESRDAALAVLDRTAERSAELRDETQSILQARYAKRAIEETCMQRTVAMHHTLSRSLTAALQRFQTLKELHN